MITENWKIKSTVCGDILDGGLTKPLEVIEQMTYMMFIHDLDETDNIHAKESAMLGLPYKSVFSTQVQLGNKND